MIFLFVVIKKVHLALAFVSALSVNRYFTSSTISEKLHSAWRKSPSTQKHPSCKNVQVYRTLKWTEWPCIAHSHNPTFPHNFLFLSTWWPLRWQGTVFVWLHCEIFFTVWNTPATAIKHFVKADIFQTANSLHFKTNWNTQGHTKREFEV